MLYQVSELRERLAAALDKASRGETVIVQRGKEFFALKKIAAKVVEDE